MDQILGVALYLFILLFIGILSIKRRQSASDFLIGGRSMNYLLTAMAAHASDMSSWLFMGFPAIIFASGLFNVWLAVGLSLFMLLNWIIVAPRLRRMTEQYNSMTLSSFYESHYHDTSGMIRIVTALISMIFYTIYISAGMVGLGLLVEFLFGFEYHTAILIGLLVVIPYLFLGGYRTLAWIDLFQGLFLLIVIVAIPLLLLPSVGGWTAIQSAAKAKDISLSLLPNLKPKTLSHIFFALCGWGIGYFGQPHIVTKFMGIRHVSEIKKSMAVGMSWQIIALGGATLVGLISIPLFNEGIQDPQLLFVSMTKGLFHPVLAAFILCAILGATISTMDAQILVLATILTEDFYKRLIRRAATSRELLTMSRLFVFAVSLLSFFIAYFKISSIYSLVFFAWSGLGSAFGPLLIFSLYSKKVNQWGAWGGMIVGGGVALFWPLMNQLLHTEIPTLIPGFLLSSLAILLLSKLKKRER